MNSSTSIKDLIERIERLEKAVYGTRASKNQRLGNKTHKGATGGLRLLADGTFFDHERQLSLVREELVKHGYRYSIHAVQMALNRLSKSSGPLVSYKVNGRKVYAKRK